MSQKLLVCVPLLSSPQKSSSLTVVRTGLRMTPQHCTLLLALSFVAFPTASAFLGGASFPIRTHAESLPSVSAVRPSLVSSTLGSNGRKSGLVAANMMFGAPEEEVDCLVIGGGVSGLTTAVYVKKAGKNVLLAEQGATLGGNIDTQVQGEYTFENGPNTFQPVDNMLKLVEELGLASELVTTDPKLPRYVFSDNDMYALPAGGGPPKDLVRLLSPFALIRAAIGAVVPTSSASTDETVADFISRTLGEEVLDKIVDPFISTVYTGDPQKMSFQSVFPGIKKIADEANQPGGLIRAFISSRIAAKKAKQDAAPASSIPAPPRGASASLKGGLGRMASAASSYLGEASRTGWSVKSLSAQPDGSYSAQISSGAGDRTVKAKTVVMAAPSGPASSLLAGLAPAAQKLADIASPPVFAVTLAYPSSSLDTSRPCSTEGQLEGFGVLVPRSAQLNSLGFQFISSMFPDRRPAGEEVVLSYYGGAQNAGVVGMSEEEVVGLVHEDAKKILLGGDAPEPKVLSVRKWEKAIPQYNCGHSQLMAEVRGALPEGVVLTGNYAGGGVSLGDCVGSGMECAEQVVELLAKAQ